jgi:tRNA-Thr(GGU) m(6)t(6)A37 methyltransferase TsaA
VERASGFDAPGALTLSPIGVVRTPYAELAEAPRQPAVARGVRGRVELAPGRGLEHAIEGIEAWTHLWVVFWFHRAGRTDVRKVRPPRSEEKRGVLATRSPHRPNPIGLSLVRLVGVTGLTLDVEDVDLVDGTPVLDLKPYVPYADFAADASSGWLPPAHDPAAVWSVELTQVAENQLAFIAGKGAPGLRDRLVEALNLGPAPHPYRRIRPAAGGGSIIAIKAWRAAFRVEGRRIIVESIATGYRPRDLAAGTGADVEVHRAFAAAFPGDQR